MFGDKRSKPIILVADDDDDDLLLIRTAFEEIQVKAPFFMVKDGEELMDFLHCRGKYHDPTSAPRPGLILLDLNMPRKDGREALMEIKADPELRQIPVVILTTSRAEEDVKHTYDLGANSFIVKPGTYEGLTNVIKTVTRYWFEVVTLPSFMKRT